MWTDFNNSFTVEFVNELQKTTVLDLSCFPALRGPSLPSRAGEVPTLLPSNRDHGTAEDSSFVLALARPSFRQLPCGSWFGVSSIVQRNEGLYLAIWLRLHYLGTKANFPTYHYWYEDYLNPAYYHSKLRQGMKFNGLHTFRLCRLFRSFQSYWWAKAILR